MPRRATAVALTEAAPETLRPLTGADSPNLQTALNAILVWSSSTAVREMAVVASGFPLQNDMPAFLLFNQLIYRGASRPTDLADVVQTTRSNVSKIVRRLEDAGLIVRFAAADDDRSVVIGLSETGRAIGQRFVQLGDDHLAGVLANWPTDEVAKLEELVVKFARSLDIATGHAVTREAGVTWPGFNVPHAASPDRHRS